MKKNLCFPLGFFFIINILNILFSAICGGIAVIGKTCGLLLNIARVLWNNLYLTHYLEKFYLIFKVINLLGNMRVNNFSKFNIPFAEGLGTAPSGVVLSIFWTSKKWRDERGRAPYYVISLKKKSNYDILK